MTSGLRGATATLACAALALTAAACASASGARPRPFPQPSGSPAEVAKPVAPDAPHTGGEPTAVVPAPPAVAPAVAALLATALDLRGVPYVNGGSDPSGFDCSGFTQWVFAHNGVKLPREVKDQFRAGLAIEADAIAAGDLVFFATTSPAASHVGIALGNGTFVHAPNSRGVVRVEHLATEYWTQRYLGTRRYFIAPASE